MSRESLRNSADFSVYDENFENQPRWKSTTGGFSSMPQSTRKIPQQTILYRKELQVKCKDLGYTKWKLEKCEILSVEVGPGEEPEIYFTWDPNRKDPDQTADQQIRRQATNEPKPMRVGIQLARGHDSICAQRTEVLSGIDQHIIELSGKSLTNRTPCTVMVAVITSDDRNEIIRKLSAIEFPVAREIDGKPLGEPREAESTYGYGDGFGAGSSRASSTLRSAPSPRIAIQIPPPPNPAAGAAGRSRSVLHAGAAHARAASAPRRG